MYISTIKGNSEQRSSKENCVHLSLYVTEVISGVMATTVSYQ